MKIGKGARSAEARVARAVDTLVGRLVGPSAAQPLEIVHGVLEEAERQVQPAARGTWVFPFNRVTLELTAPSRDTRAALAAVVGPPDALRDRIVERLRHTCAVEFLQVRIRYRPAPGADWARPDYHVAFDTIAPPAPLVTAPVMAQAHGIEFAVASGVTEQRRFTFAGGRIDIGRGQDVVDAKQRLLRRNQVVFTEGGGEANQTVSRRHAHVVYRDASREYRVYDDNSARGTNIIRAGTTIPVPSGTRGVRVQSGDEIVLGQARLRVKIG
ncbi:MAG TPA: FHA domain-containing protein [Vicinamibacterales bacterium]|nr:FHA domain-containing protein [Vicinamibacterales bacterium]